MWKSTTAVLSTQNWNISWFRIVINHSDQAVLMLWPRDCDDFADSIKGDLDGLRSTERNSCRDQCLKISRAVSDAFDLAIDNDLVTLSLNS